MCLHGVLVGTEIWHSVDKSFVSRRRPVKYSVGKGLPTQQEADPDSPPTPLNDYCPTWKTRSCCTNMKASNSQLALGKQHWWPQMNRREQMGSATCYSEKAFQVTDRGIQLLGAVLSLTKKELHCLLLKAVSARSWGRDLGIQTRRCAINPFFPYQGHNGNNPHKV